MVPTVVRLALAVGVFVLVDCLATTAIFFVADELGVATGAVAMLVFQVALLLSFTHVFKGPLR